MALQEGQATRDNLFLEPEHTVFLSHSGSQKAFVEQLDVDLRRCDRYPFFDKERDSLPIGEPFPDHIFKAIRHCKVGMVVLSEEFLSSKWPMEELVEMVQTIESRPGEMRIIPIFLSISCEDLGDEKKVLGWKAKWAKFDKRTSICEYESALKVLKATKGLIFNSSVGEVKFREDIVKTICNIVPPFHSRNDSHVQGRGRLREVILEKIEKIPISQKYGTQVVGLYGVGGIGKTTTCKSLYKDLYMKYEGRVCHLEFGNASSKQGRLLEVLKKLTDSDNEVLKDLNVDQLRSRLNDLMKKKKVFLAIDNVSDYKSIKEAKKYLEAGYCPGSIVLVTTRALDVLMNLKVDVSDCLEMPELEIDEARSLFLYHADPRIEVNECALMHCVRRCYFSKGKGRNSHYHPLALKVLGRHLAGENPEEWERQLKEVDVFNQRRELENPIFSVLRRSFDELMEEDKMMFMDVVLFDTQDDYKRWGISMRDLWIGWAEFLGDERRWFIFEWLSMVHGISVDDVKKRLNVLKKKSLLEELGDGLAQIGMHDLWREFGMMESKRGELKSRRCVYEIVKDGVVDSIIFGGGWQNVQRICVMGGLKVEQSRVTSFETKVDCLNFSESSEATVLKLVNVVVESNVLDLAALRQLRSLEMVFQWLKPKQLVSGIRSLTNLKVLTWLCINLKSISTVEEISYLKHLEVLQLACHDQAASLKLDLNDLICLREVRIEMKGELTISGLSSRMTNFRILDLGKCWSLRSCLGVDELVALEVLLLNGCWKLGKLPDLKNLTSLRIFDVRDCGLLKQIPGLGNLIALQKFYGGGPFLKYLPDGGNFSKLENVKIRGWPGECAGDFNDNFTYIEPNLWHRLSLDLWRPVSLNLAMLESVSTLFIRDWAYGLTNLGKLTRLQQLKVEDCGVKSLSGLASATTLKKITLHNVSLESLPDMGKDMRLESLVIRKCSRLTGWDGVDSSELENGGVLQCSWNLCYLEVLILDGCGNIELPDLSCFPKLRQLHIFDSIRTSSSLHCYSDHLQLQSLELKHMPIKELPDLSTFPCLKHIILHECKNLTRLRSSGLLTVLKTLKLVDCPNLEVLPIVDLFPSLTVVYIGKVKVDVQLVENLRSRNV